MAHTKANDLSAVGIGDQAQVSKVLFNTDISNITYPQLTGPLWYQIAPQIRIFPEAVNRKSSPRPIPFPSTSSP